MPQGGFHLQAHGFDILQDASRERDMRHVRLLTVALQFEDLANNVRRHSSKVPSSLLQGLSRNSIPLACTLNDQLGELRKIRRGLMIGISDELGQGIELPELQDLCKQRGLAVFIQCGKNIAQGLVSDGMA